MKPSPTVPALLLQTRQGIVVEHLRHLILSRQLLPGERLVQDELAARLGVSRTPIREALYQLAQEGLVTISSYKGAFVADFTLSDMKDVFAIRTALESHASYLAAQNLTGAQLDQLDALLHEIEESFLNKDFERLLETHHRFHATIYAAATSPGLYALILQYMDLANVYQRMALSLGRGAQGPVVEHKGILEALRRRDAVAARDLLRVHLEITIAELLTLFSEQSDYKEIGEAGSSQGGA